MKKTSTTKRSILRISCFALMACAILVPTGIARAEVLMLDFGPSSSTQNPVGPASTAHGGEGIVTDMSWNKITAGNSDVSAGNLVFADGSTASGIALDTGVETASGSYAIDWSSSVVTQMSGSSGAPKYARGPVIRDYMRGGYGGPMETFDRMIAIRISGLAPGEYDVYAIATDSYMQADSNVQYGATFDLYVGADNGQATTNLQGFANGRVTNLGSKWIDGDTYWRTNVSVGAGENLVIGSERIEPWWGRRGQFNAIQIVPTPEPATMSLLGLGGVVALLRRRRKT
ncbi:MAG: PEP-CTERM sorting domain-containing protein [Phycisphaerae bacterium]|jgi:hypothetical protein|nr:PEP-CTERM sorting domain-containing protein [Phycisphaerae bacterium]